ncbi:MAG: hypothetical protein OXR66_07960 [Candidatus Woesearchaeota archaeon]|nr:hypothetical protein [Candidatus Woesearchaeota archaeon]
MKCQYKAILTVTPIKIAMNELLIRKLVGLTSAKITLKATMLFHSLLHKGTFLIQNRSVEFFK